ncbi:MAG: DMT family transporter, partial [Candidatus Dadabacteria bacterium]|nr:DMT family transporter [Candidatus Dadabacteria bacterium]NIS09604.1 DMT family transporter [Candidatus Dadabacteria bacterium]NIY22779.1 EamA family transporter [Candidatus Dadabacteria bacterium]
CYAFYIVINRRISDAVDSMKRSFYQFFFGFIVLVPFVFTLENVSISLNDIYWLTGISFFQGFLAITFIIIAIKNLKAIEYGTISYVEPLVASLIGYLLYSEQLSMLQIFGCAIILVCGLVQVIMTKNRL